MVVTYLLYRAREVPPSLSAERWYVQKHSTEREKFPPRYSAERMDRPYELQFLRETYRLSITWPQQSPWSVVGTLRVGVGPRNVNRGGRLPPHSHRLFYIYYDLWIILLRMGLRPPLLLKQCAVTKADGGVLLSLS